MSQNSLHWCDLILTLDATQIAYFSHDSWPSYDCADQDSQTETHAQKVVRGANVLHKQCMSVVIARYLDK